MIRIIIILLLIIFLYNIMINNERLTKRYFLLKFIFYKISKFTYIHIHVSVLIGQLSKKLI